MAGNETRAASGSHPCASGRTEDSSANGAFLWSSVLVGWAVAAVRPSSWCRAAPDGTDVGRGAAVGTTSAGARPTPASAGGSDPPMSNPTVAATAEAPTHATNPRRCRPCRCPVSATPDRPPGRSSTRGELSSSSHLNPGRSERPSPSNPPAPPISGEVLHATATDRKPLAPTWSAVVSSSYAGLTSP